VLTTGSWTDVAGATLTFPELASSSVPGGRVADADGEQSGTMLTKVEAGDWTAAIGFGRRRKQVPTGSFQSLLGDPDTYTVDWRAFGYLRYETVRPNFDRASVKLGLDGYGYTGSYSYSDGIVGDFQRSRWLSLEGQYVHRIGEHQRILVGGEVRSNRRLEQGTTTETASVFFDRRRSNVVAGFIQDEIRVSRLVLVNLGLRHDRYDAFGGTTNPRAALIVNPAGTTTIKALAGRAFRAPSAYELYYHDGSVTQKPGLRLAPERLTSLELIGEHQFGRSARMTVSAYRLRFQDAITLVMDHADGLLVYQNVGRADGRGLEVEMTGSVGSAVDLRLAYAYQRVSDRISAKDLPNTPRQLGRIGAAAPVGRSGLTISGDLRAVGSRARNDTIRVPGYLLANLSVAQSRSARFDWGIAVFNLFDRQYGDPGGDEHEQIAIPQDGRTVRLRASVRF
jgi:iron complex outermembrane receptor protein